MLFGQVAGECDSLEPVRCTGLLSVFFCRSFPGQVDLLLCASSACLLAASSALMMAFNEGQCVADHTKVMESCRMTAGVCVPGQPPMKEQAPTGLGLWCSHCLYVCGAAVSLLLVQFGTVCDFTSLTLAAAV